MPRISVISSTGVGSACGAEAMPAAVDGMTLSEMASERMVSYAPFSGSK